MSILFCKIRKICQGKGVTPGFLLVLLIILSLQLLTPLNRSALGQADQSLLVQAPDTSDFPEITIPFKIPTLFKELNSTLTISDLLVYENDIPIQPATLNQTRSGVHFTLTINPSRQFDLRDSDGVSPFDKIVESLVNWTEERSSLSEDRWSFVSESGVEINSSNNRQAWIEVVSNYQADFRGLEPQLASLETAVNLASERVVPFGVDKALLYITPAPLPDQINGVLELTQRAISAGLQVNVWMVDEAYYLSNDQGGALLDLANNTGGNFFHFTGTESIPNLDTYLENSGYYFELSYPSMLRETGTFPLRIEVTTAEVTLSGESPPFQIEVRPPNPILISPPAVIERVGTDSQIEDLSPSAQRIEIMVEYPDCHPRQIVSSRLYVDGRVVDERDAPPFDVFNWDLSSLKKSGEHAIQVEVEDSLGFIAKTILTPVQIQILLPEPEEKTDLRRIGLILLGIILAISVILLMIWLVRRYWQPKHFMSHIPKKISEVIPAGVLSQKPILDKKGVQALLVPLGSDPGVLEGALKIEQSRVNIGQDPIRSNLIIKEPGVDGLHALFLQDNGEFWINDLGSCKGTWLNYVRIGKQPVRIQPGDLIHFGESGFRFTIIDNINASQVNVSKYEPIL
jgi:hypothetical protein